MQELSIKIKIYDRQYPMKVQPKDEEQIRKAAAQINEQIKVYKEQFGNIDIQDILSIIAVDCMVDRLKLQRDRTLYQEGIEQKLHHLIKMVAPVT